jgi:endonuclease VIII
MEGPSLYLASQQLTPFIHQRIKKVSGNTKIGKERMQDKEILDIFSWGKHLIFQFDTFALRVHFLLYGTFEATVNRKRVTGDYKKKKRIPRLVMTFKNGHIDMYSCSVKYLETPDAKSTYDYTVDIMSDAWDDKKALKKIIETPNREIDDVLLDQKIFSGVGNIIKNESLFLVKMHPQELIGNISLAKLKKLIKTVQEYCHQFYEWRKKFELKKHYQVYRKGICPRCSSKIMRKTTGEWKRYSFICPNCQKLKKNPVVSSQ